MHNIDFVPTFLPEFNPFVLPLPILQEDGRYIDRPDIANQVEARQKEECAHLESLFRIFSRPATGIDPGRIRQIHLPYFTSQLSQLLAERTINVGRILFDSATCGYCDCIDRNATPIQPTYITESAYKKLRGIRIRESFISTALCCIAPLSSLTPFLICAPISPWLTASGSFTTAMCGYFITGCLTHYWGTGTHMEYEVAEQLEKMTSDVALYIQKEWTDGIKREEIFQRCCGIAANRNSIIEAMTNQGITSEHAVEIFKPLEEIISTIRAQHELQLPYQSI